MNKKLSGFIAVMALAAYAQTAQPASTENVAPVEPVLQNQTAQTTEVAPAPQVAPETEAAPVANATPAVETTPAVEAVAETAPVEAAPVDTPVPATNTVAKAVSVTQVESAAPKAVRGAAEYASPSTATVYYESVYATPEGTPVRTVYVAERATEDTTTLEKLMGFYPMKFKIGAFGSVGAHQLSGNEWDSDSYSGMTWKAGLMSIIPLNDYSMGFKVGVIFEQAKASESYYINKQPTNFSFKEKKIDVPVLFTFKAPSSRVYFDLGTEMSFPIYDKLKISTTKDGNRIDRRIDMIDDGYRGEVDWSFVLGMSIMANNYVSLDVHGNIGLSNYYSGHLNDLNMNLSSSSFNVGITLYPF